LAAKDHCDDLGKKGLRGHFGSDASSPFDRISIYGKPGWWRGENISYNEVTVPMSNEEVDDMAREIVLKMFIDEGLAGRPSRHRLLNPEFDLVGIYSCAHRSTKSMTVIDYSGTLDLNDHAKQGVMAAHERNAAQASPVYVDPTEEEEPSMVESCSKLPSEIVTEKDCASFKLMNEIRSDPKSIVPALRKVRSFLESDDNIFLVQSIFNQTPSKLNDDQVNYDTLIRIDRAISALERSTAVP